MGGYKSRLKDCLQQSTNKHNSLFYQVKQERGKGLFINEVPQVGGGGLTLYGTTYEGLSKTGNIVGKRGCQKFP